MLPLAAGLPVMLVDHLDRNPEKQLLRGKIGHVHSWVEDADETSIASNVEVLLDFHTTAWSIPGALGPGIYPIFRVERTW